MSSRPNHIVRNLQLEVEFQQHNDAFAWRNTLTEVFKTELLPALEKLFNEKMYGGKVIKADEIVIDLGTIHQEQWNKTLVERVIKELTEHFSLAVPQSNTGTQSAPEDETGKILWERPNAITKMTEDDNNIQSILHFLKTGLLPWYSVIKSQREFAEHFNQLLSKPGIYFHKQVLATVADGDALIRLVDQLPENILKSLALRSDITTVDMQVLLSSWTKIFEESRISLERVKQIAYRAVIGALCEVFPERPSTGSISENLIGILTKDQHEKITAMFMKSSQSFPATNEGENKIVQRIRHLVIEKHRSEGRVPNNEAQKGSAPATDTLRPTKDNLQGRSKKKPIKDIDDGGLFVTNAGLVILHPFLVRLFENVGYLEERKWVSENQQQRAILLTQYLVTGKQEYPEFDLLLNKLMTGYPLENSLPADILLSDFEIKEAEEALKSVLTHWKVLKNTSIPGLQSTFLQREGKLQYSDGRWLLQIERKTVDILLDKLPWGIGIIKLPWMESRLHVEWA
jgi:hypothetical protein